MSRVPSILVRLMLTALVLAPSSALAARCGECPLAARAKADGCTGLKRDCCRHHEGVPADAKDADDGQPARPASPAGHCNYACPTCAPPPLQTVRPVAIDGRFAPVAHDRPVPYADAAPPTPVRDTIFHPPRA